MLRVLADEPSSRHGEGDVVGTLAQALLRFQPSLFSESPTETPAAMAIRPRPKSCSGILRDRTRLGTKVDSKSHMSTAAE